MNPHVSQHWNLKPARLPFRHTCFLLFAQKHYNNTIKSGVCQYHFSKMQYYFNVFFQKLLTKAKKIDIIFRQAKKRRSASMEKYSRGRRGAPAKGVGRVTGAKVQILSSPPKKTVVLLGDCLFSFCRRIFEPERRSADNVVKPSRRVCSSARRAKLQKSTKCQTLSV